MAKLTAERMAEIAQQRGEPAICECCGYPSTELAEYRGPVTHNNLAGEGTLIFCHICASTFLSHCKTYPLLYGEHSSLWSSIGWIANHLQDEIRKQKGLA